MATGKKYQKARTGIPASVKRTIVIESRYSCIVDQERVALQFHHIDGNRDNHDPENIAHLCANCHVLAEQGKITHLALKEFKKKAQEENEEIRKLRQEIEYLTKGPTSIVSPAFNQVQTKYQNILSGFSDKIIFYQSFIYLIPQFFLDKRGERTREIVRELLGIKPEEEETIISHLKTAALIDITGDLVSLKDKTDAKVALNELIDTGRIDLDAVTHLLLNI